MLKVFLFVLPFFAFSQNSSFLKPSDTLHKARINFVIATQTTLSATSILALDRLWYSDFERGRFKSVNDNSHWLQVDKAGHAFSAYQLSRLGANSLNWAGVSKNTQLIYGTGMAMGFLTAIEIMDGFSEEWGFSWGDMAANALGGGLYAGQELLWKEQRIALKFSFHQTQYASLRPETLGNGLSEEIFKDYNGQTYWLSFNLHSFFKESRLPKWLNVAFGYGAEGMLTAEEDDLLDGIISPERYRQFYLSLDVDLTKIKTNSHLLRTLFDVFNLIKMPFPALEINGKGVVKLHYIYF
ncbi:DUF2279 domain-containing protein [Paucihalobacter ruber]|uniref:DUF2279 domain-containing protein n=1 Tax=Paucihalobacter ruber TaxID=2567861 RepID=A0A506PFK7_9FLAO|nr:DUF2279 domain-containing protein [Paucihalobacter ruber]TPV32268.1 DUF2279 domain-containing protein [Paucihalobacter ruber]